MVDSLKSLKNRLSYCGMTDRYLHTNKEMRVKATSHMMVSGQC